MTNSRKRECPYANSTELEEAIVAAGSVDSLAQKIAASPTTVRKWCKDMGASTRTGKIGAPRASCPFTSAEELGAALEKLGSVAEIARHYEVAYNTALRWCRERGVSTHREAVRGGDDRMIIDRMTNAELEAMISALGYDRAAVVFGVSKMHLSSVAAERDIEVRSTKTPKVAMLQRRVRDLETEGNSVRELIEELRYAAETVSVLPPPALPRADRKRKRETPVDVVLHVCDKQYGEVVHAEDTPGGRFSPEIYEDERLPRYVEAVEALLENISYSNPIGTVWFAQGGDFVEGHGVFNGQEWHLALDAGAQVVRLSRAWSGAVARLATRAKAVGANRVAVVSVVGNHGVPQGRKGGALPPSLSFDYLCYESVRHQLASLPNNGGVDWYDESARKAVYFETQGGIILLTHGDQDRGGGLVGAPVVTGLKNDLQVRLSTGIQHYLHLKGHYHRPTQITVGSDSMTIWSGAWIGTNNLSIGRGGASAPSQNMHVLHPEHGLIATHRVKLSESVESIPVVIQ